MFPKQNSMCLHLLYVTFFIYITTKYPGFAVDTENFCFEKPVCDSIKDVLKRINSLEQPVWKITNDNIRWPACNEGPCQCSPPSFSVNCYRLSLKRLPESQTIPKDILTLDLGSNEIRSIHRDSFKFLHRLVQLDFSNNGLEYLPNQIFDGLESLKHLLLQRNRLETLNNAIFKTMINLQTLDLSENLFSKFSPDEWQGLNSLSLLQLSNNQITSFETLLDALPKLNTLDLSVNRLIRLGKIYQKSLTTFKLSNNELSSIDAQAFQGLHNLESLNLHQNKLEDLPPSIFQRLDKLIFLDLSNNLLYDISEEQWWRDLKILKELQLQGNLLEILRNDTFNQLVNLERLKLSGNNIQVIEDSAFAGLENLSTLLLTNNMIRKLVRSTLEPLQNLSRLDLDSNNLEFMEEDSLHALSNLKTIKLAKNAWHCDCKILHLANWIRDHSPLIFDNQPKCQSPGHLAGKFLYSMTFADVCDGQWLSMQNIPTRV